MATPRAIAALFVSRRSIYKHLPGVDCFDRSRGVANFAGSCPVVAHPPCRCWSKYLAGQAMPTHLDEERRQEMDLGLWAVKTVLKCGGVLEQPAKSKLWEAANLPAVGDRRDPFCYTVYLEQSWFGFPTPKPTWILVCGLPAANLPSLPYRFMPKSLVEFHKLNSFERSRTMKPLAEWLCQAARATWWSLP